MKYDLQNLNDVAAANGEIIKISEILSGLLSRSVEIRRELEDAESVLSTPERDVSDILRHADLIKEYGSVFHGQLAAAKKLHGLVNKIYDSLQKDYDLTVNTIKA